MIMHGWAFLQSGAQDGRTRTPLQHAATHRLTHSASLAFENWTGRNSNETKKKKGKEAERVKIACVTTIRPPGALAKVPDAGGTLNVYRERRSSPHDFIPQLYFCEGHSQSQEILHFCEFFVQTRTGLGGKRH